MLTDAQIATYQTTGALLLKGAFAGYVDGARGQSKKIRPAPAGASARIDPTMAVRRFFRIMSSGISLAGTERWSGNRRCRKLPHV